MKDNTAYYHRFWLFPLAVAASPGPDIFRVHFSQCLSAVMCAADPRTACVHNH